MPTSRLCMVETLGDGKGWVGGEGVGGEGAGSGRGGPASSASQPLPDRGRPLGPRLVWEVCLRDGGRWAVRGVRPW